MLVLMTMRVCAPRQILYCPAHPDQFVGPAVLGLWEWVSSAGQSLYGHGPARVM